MEDFSFDIEKVESLDYNKLSKQLKYIFKEEQDIVNFINFLKQLQNFVNLSNDKRHMELINLSYFKSQLQLYEKRIQSLITKKEEEQIRNAIKKAKGIGEKVTENIIIYCKEEDNTLNGLRELYMLVNSWTTFINDLYYLTGQTNKNIGNIY